MKTSQGIFAVGVQCSSCNPDSASFPEYTVLPLFGLSVMIVAQAAWIFSFGV